MNTLTISHEEDKEEQSLLQQHREKLAKNKAKKHKSVQEKEEEEGQLKEEKIRKVGSCVTL